MKKIKLHTHLRIKDQELYKIHFMRPNKDDDEPAHPYECSLKEVTQDWQNCQGDNDRWGDADYIFALVQMPEKPEYENLWLFLGIFKILRKTEDGYRTQWSDKYKEFFNRLIVKYNHRAKNNYFNLEGLYNKLILHKINDTAINKDWSLV